MKTPIVTCERTTIHGALQWRFWCRYCKTYHYHGAKAGHRVAHCGDLTETPSGDLVRIQSPYRETGYILRAPKKAPRLKKGT
jgi:hypothetical protein